MFKTNVFFFSMVSPNLVQVPDEEKLMSADETENVPAHRSGPRKSVSIVLPEEENG